MLFKRKVAPNSYMALSVFLAHFSAKIQSDQAKRSNTIYIHFFVFCYQLVKLFSARFSLFELKNFEFKI
jgi:hypothetical protein